MEGRIGRRGLRRIKNAIVEVLGRVREQVIHTAQQRAQAIS
jgi:hypothetical protein